MYIMSHCLSLSFLLIVCSIRMTSAILIPRFCVLKIYVYTPTKNNQEKKVSDLETDSGSLKKITRNNH